jgi:hypothetical protein
MNLNHFLLRSRPAAEWYIYTNTQDETDLHISWRTAPKHTKGQYLDVAAAPEGWFAAGRAASRKSYFPDGLYGRSSCGFCSASGLDHFLSSHKTSPADPAYGRSMSHAINFPKALNRSSKNRAREAQVDINHGEEPDFMAHNSRANFQTTKLQMTLVETQLHRDHKRADSL